MLLHKLASAFTLQLLLLFQNSLTLNATSDTDVSIAIDLPSKEGVVAEDDAVSLPGQPLQVLPFSEAGGLVATLQKAENAVSGSHPGNPGHPHPGSRRRSRGRRRSTRRRSPSRRRSSRRRRGSRGRRRSRRPSSRRRSSQPPTPAPAPAPAPTPKPPPPPAPKPKGDQQRLTEDDIKKVVLPDNIEYVGTGGCEDSRTKFYSGIIAAGTGPTKWQMYKPKKAEVPMTLQRCIDILHTLDQYTENGRRGIQGLRGLRFGACQGGVLQDMGCACYILGDSGAEGKVRQVKIPKQPEWPQQCCNPPGYGCWPCHFNIPGDRGGGRGPIAGPGGGFAGVCYRLKKTIDR